MAPTPDTYAPEFFASLFAIEDRHFWFRARNQVIGSLVGNMTAHLAPGYRVLEVGCGTGTVLRTLEQTCKNGVVTGVDLYEEALHYARQRTTCRLLQGDARELLFDETFHLIGLFDVLEHLPDDVRVLRDLRRLLEPNGALMLTVPAHPSLWSYFDESAHHCRRYQVAELENKLADSGYRIEFLTQYMAALFPLIWLGRRLAALKARRAASGTGNGALAQARDLARGELRIVPILNELLSFWLLQEARWVARRRRLPIGTSLLAIARKSDD